jgi:uncharacterized membrane protein
VPNLHVLTGAGPTYPIIRKIGVADLKDAVAKGIHDFLVMPTHVIFVAIIYPIVGLFLARMTFGYDMMPLLFPLAAGFALIGPFAAIGLYELSRQREKVSMFRGRTPSECCDALPSTASPLSEWS